MLTLSLAILQLPISPTDLPWWGWLLVAFGLILVGLVVGGIAEGSGSGLLGIVKFGFYLAAAIAAVIGVVDFIKLVWGRSVL